jgi:hypothetical protein
VKGKRMSLFVLVEMNDDLGGFELRWAIEE